MDESFALEHNGAIERIDSIEEQVVSGKNYKIVFESAGEKYEALIYYQRWTGKLEIRYIKKLVNQN